MRPRARSAAVFSLALLAAACNGSSTSPSSTAVAAPTASEDFADTLAIGGVKFYSFTVGTRGTVNLTLNSVSGTGVDPSVQIGLAIGSPSGTSCAAATPTTTGSGTAPQVTGTYSAGVLCAQVSDVGNLTAPIKFDVTIAHP